MYLLQTSKGPGAPFTPLAVRPNRPYNEEH